MDSSVVSNQEDSWTSTKRVVTHKKRETETVVSRDLVMEDGQLVRDSGPQVVSRSKEEEDKTESESNSKARPLPRVKAGNLLLVPDSVAMTTDSQTKRTVSTKQEHSRFHDERLTDGKSVHQMAVVGATPVGQLIDFYAKSRTDSLLETKRETPTSVEQTMQTESKEEEEFPGQTLPEVMRTHSFDFNGETARALNSRVHVFEPEPDYDQGTSIHFRQEF